MKILLDLDDYCPFASWDLSTWAESLCNLEQKDCKGLKSEKCPLAKENVEVQLGPLKK